MLKAIWSWKVWCRRIF